MLSNMNKLEEAEDIIDKYITAYKENMLSIYNEERLEYIISRINTRLKMIQDERRSISMIKQLCSTDDMIKN